MKKLATIAASAALLVAAVLPVAAANSCTNGTTGPFSTNNCSINNTSNVTVNNVNDSVVINNIRSVANTGGNSASRNTLGGSITTGNAVLNTTVGTVTNVNTTNITGGPGMGNNSGSNNITGPGNGSTNGTNDVLIENRQLVNVDNQNTSYVLNNVFALAGTGMNNADENTGPGVIRTGNAGLLLNVNTHNNDNLTNVAAGTGGSGVNSAGNSTTGPFSINDVTISNLADIRVRNYNDMVVNNTVDAIAGTGRNSASTNTLGGNITTGNAGAGVGVNTEGNINTSLVSVPMFSASNEGGNGVTGPGSSNDSNLNNDYNVGVDNMNNKCLSHNALTLATLLGSPSVNPLLDCNPWDLGVNNDVNATSNTGRNIADEGTGPAVVVSGIGELIQQVLTHMNDTLTRIGQ